MSVTEAPPLTTELCLVDGLSTMLAGSNSKVGGRSSRIVGLWSAGPDDAVGLAVECGETAVPVTILE